MPCGETSERIFVAKGERKAEGAKGRTEPLQGRRKRKGNIEVIYIIMCGGNYAKWETPRQLLEIKGEPIVARTIRLLRENGVDAIFISSNDERFKTFGVPVLQHENDYFAREYNNMDGYWCNAFYLTEEPTCYLFGDVVYSPAAIKTIVETETNDIAFFGSAWPFSPQYPKPYIEPFGFKVVDTDRFKEAIAECKRIAEQGRFYRRPIAWELWNVIHNPWSPNDIDTKSYVHINDYTCDIDNPNEVGLLTRLANEME